MNIGVVRKKREYLGRLSVEIGGVCGEGSLLQSFCAIICMNFGCQKLLLRGLACLILYFISAKFR